MYIAELEFGISGFCSVLDAYVEIASQIKYFSIIVGISFIKIFGNLEILKRKKKTKEELIFIDLRKLKLWNHSQ